MQGSNSSTRENSKIRKRATELQRQKCLRMLAVVFSISTVKTDGYSRKKTVSFRINYTIVSFVAQWYICSTT